MKRSTDRILVSHAGALPRPPDLRDLLINSEEGKPYDEAAYNSRVRYVVDGVVQKQLDTGIDVINGGQALREWVDDPTSRPGDLDALASADEARWRSEIADFLLY